MNDDIYDILVLSGITEAKAPSKPKTTTKIDLDSPMSKGEVSKAAKPNVSKVKSKSSTSSTNFTSPTGASDIMKKFMNNTTGTTDTVNISHEIEMGDTDDVPVGVDPTPKPPGTSLAIPKQDLVKFNDLYNEVPWHQLKNTPGYRIMQIRGAFRPLFKQKIGAELEDVIVSTTLDPSMSEETMKHLIGYISKYGQKDDEFELEAFGIDPREYKIEKAFVYNFEGMKFLILKERMYGRIQYYVYSAKSGSGSSIGDSDHKFIK